MPKKAAALLHASSLPTQLDILVENAGLSPMVTTARTTQGRVVLNNISWQTFETILTEMGEDRATRLAYDRGRLEIMTPLMPHESNKRLVEKIIGALAEELQLNLRSAGSLTCKRPDLQRGVEPDSCFYIQNEPLIRQKRDIDLTIDPPPDLAIEVDYTSASVDSHLAPGKLNVYSVTKCKRTHSFKVE